MTRVSLRNDGPVRRAGRGVTWALLTAIALAALLGVAGCASVPETIEEGLSPAGFFQRAQEASDSGRYEAAQKYYEVFLERFPDETERRLWAKYEIAFLYHKMGRDKLAIEGFDALLEEYALGPSDLPQGPKVLAEKVKARLEEKTQDKAETAPAETAPAETTPAETTP
jgi:tetratricopeptide (TPR) repeat protein